MSAKNLRFGLFLGLFLICSVAVHGIDLWPMPKSVSHGSKTLYVSREFGLYMEGSNYSDGSGILKGAFERMVDLVEASHVIDGNSSGSGVLSGVNVVVHSPEDSVLTNPYISLDIFGFTQSKSQKLEAVYAELLT